MGTIVSKFGGSSTADARQFVQIHHLIEASPSRRCVVLSAPGIDQAHKEKVTSQLERCWNYRDDPSLLDGLLHQISVRFREIAQKLDLPDVYDHVSSEIEQALRISRERTLSRGEYLCAKLFSRYSSLPMVDAAELIAFDGNGRLEESRTAQNLEAAGRQYGRFVMPGFYGADPSGRIRTFPRNGSDISGALAAAYLGAGLYENWTDVPGLMTADPAIVPRARLIPQIGYRQMRALARAGAQVLHPGCLDPVELAGIPTRLRRTEDPGCFGTLIDERFDRTVPCIAGSRTACLPGGRVAARVSVFGADRNSAERASQILSPAEIQESTDHVDVFVEPSRYNEAVRLLHHALIEGAALPTDGYN